MQRLVAAAKGFYHLKLTVGMYGIVIIMITTIHTKKSLERKGINQIRKTLFIEKRL